MDLDSLRLRIHLGLAMKVAVIFLWVARQPSQCGGIREKSLDRKDVDLRGTAATNRDEHGVWRGSEDVGNEVWGRSLTCVRVLHAMAFQDPLELPSIGEGVAQELQLPLQCCALAASHGPQVCHLHFTPPRSLWHLSLLPTRADTHENQRRTPSRTVMAGVSAAMVQFQYALSHPTTSSGLDGMRGPPQTVSRSCARRRRPTGELPCQTHTHTHARRPQPASLRMLPVSATRRA